MHLLPELYDEYAKNAVAINKLPHLLIDAVSV